MISRLAVWWVDRQVERRLDGVYIDGLEHLEGATAAGPVVVACTHQSWWDGLVAIWLCRRLKLRPAFVMDDHNLSNYPFFAAVGAIGVRGARGVRDALGRLEGPGDVLWIFPQGGYASHSQRPLVLERGAVWLAAKAACPVLPIALGYRHAEQPEVRAFLAVRAPVEPDEAGLQRGLIEGLEVIDARSHDGSFRALIGGVPMEVSVGTRAVAWIWRSMPWIR